MFSPSVKKSEIVKVRLNWVLLRSILKLLWWIGLLWWIVSILRWILDLLLMMIVTKLLRLIPKLMRSVAIEVSTKLNSSKKKVNSALYKICTGLTLELSLQGQTSTNLIWCRVDLFYNKNSEYIFVYTFIVMCMDLY